jgi:hypothetical protein
MKSILLTLFAVASAAFSFAQTAKVQIIHNSPTPTVDVWANSNRLLDDFAFRTATPYVDVPAGVQINLGIALGNSTAASQSLATIPVTFLAGRRYVVVATGIVGGNPGFELKVFDQGREKSATAGNVDLLFFHGSPDAPQVDITTGGTNVLFDNTSYGEFKGYQSVPAAKYTLNVTPGNNNATIVASYDADFGFWKGETAVVFASGFLTGNRTPSFEPWVALSNGGTFPLKAIGGGGGGGTPTGARLQVIHNSPTPTVDIYANGSLLLDNFAFRTATPYIDVPAGVQINLAVAPASSTSAAQALATFPVTLAAGKTYIAVASGVVNGTPGFDIKIFDKGREKSANASNVDLLFFHGSPDAPEVDILAGPNVLFDNISFGNFSSDYQSVPAAPTYTLGVTPGNNNSNVLARYRGAFDFWKGNTAVVFASGFLTAGRNPGFEPWVALSNGGTFPLSAITSFSNDPTFSARKTDAIEWGVFPNPVSEELNISGVFNSENEVLSTIFDQTGRIVSQKNLGIYSEGNHIISMPVNDLTTGYYFVRIVSGNQVENLKFVKY